MTSIKDIAKAANVSPAAVSRILNRQGSFSKETIQRVQECAQALNYRPNALSRSIRAKNTGIIGVLLPNCAIPIYARALSGIINECSRHGYNVILSSSYTSTEEEEQAISALAQRPMDALIYLPRNTASAHYTARTFSDIPLVGLYRRTIGQNTPSVYADMVQAGYLTTQYLLMTGHRRIAFMAGFYDETRIGGIDGFLKLVDSDLSGSFTSVDRYRGHLKALKEAGIEPDPSLIYICSMHPSCAEDVFMRILIDGRVDAVIATNDGHAVRGIRFLKSCGKRVPEDISVIGFNNDYIAESADVPLTTIHVPMYEMGCHAICLIQKMHQEESSSVPSLALPVQLKVRASTSRK